jgi:molecular chaperone GrpE
LKKKDKNAKDQEAEEKLNNPTAEVKEEISPKPKSVDEKYEDALKEIDDLKKKRLYLQAEMENSQKIALKRIENNKFNIKVNVISNFLPIVDSFEAAISKYETTSKQDYQQLLEGLKSLQKQFLQVLKSLGIKPIEQIYVPFNYKEHEVFMKLLDEEQPEDTVIKIAQKGYYLGENVLRPAKVIVSKKKEPLKAIPVEATVIEDENGNNEIENENLDDSPSKESEKNKSEDSPNANYIS